MIAVNKLTPISCLSIFSRLLPLIIVALLLLNLSGCGDQGDGAESSDIIIENAEMRLVLGSDGSARSLIHKASGQECLVQDVHEPFFAITQERPYDNELQLAYPAKSKTFAADSIYRLGDELIIRFELTDYEATVGLNITDNYIGFTLNKLEYHMAEFGIKRKTRIDEFILLQLPVRERAHFGEWLNVVWDEEVAVNVLAADPYARIDATHRNGYKLLYAGGSADVRIEGVGAVLITTQTGNLLDRVDRVERDFGLPLGVESRRSKEYRNSYYECRDVTPRNIDEHIAYAKLGGFRQMVIYYPDFATSMGHFPWKSAYANGMEDLKQVTGKIEAAGMIPGFHIHYSKAEINDRYVTPVPDNRLNIRSYYTLARDLDKGATTVYVENNPAGITLEDKRRILKIGTELIAYESYTTEPPYRFLNCERGALNTLQDEYQSGDLMGLLDVDTWPIFVRFDQNTSIQEEVAERLAGIVEEAGFRFLYYDGAEDVPPPYWYNVSKAQLNIHNALKVKPLFSEGALKSHFSWHIITRGNAFDTFEPEFIKEATRKHPLAEMELVSNDFTSIDFGWIKFTPPGDKTIGIQPDMLEFVTSRAAGWNSIISLLGDLDHFRNHPRTTDNLEVIRRWEEVRVTDFLSDEQKESLRSHEQEHILIINENGDFELHSCKQIENVANGSKDIRAFLFERNNHIWVAYWHTSGDGEIELPVDSDQIHLFQQPGTEIPFEANLENTILPAGNRCFIELDLTEEEVVDIFKKAKVQ